MAEEKEPWVMPKWMEKYRVHLDRFGGGNPVEELMNDGGKSNVFNNAPRAMICCQMIAMVHLLQLLYNEDQLTPTDN